LLALVYLFFVFVFTLKFLNQFISLKDVRSKELIAISTKWQDFVKTTASSLNIKRNIIIKISKSVVTPLTIGFIKPIILIPIAAINHLKSPTIRNNTTARVSTY
jgi:beta-lactamase regulating signal transducer with metallopeptidase domain